MTDLVLPEDYASVLADLKQRVRQARYQAQRRVNAELIALYWQIGRVLVDRTDRAQWGDKVITRLSEDLRAEFPGSTGFSPRNLLYMRSFARAWPDLGANAQQPAARLQWGHLMVLVDKLGERDLLDWYAAQAVTHGWSRAVLEHHIKTLAHTRFGTAPTNFDRILSPDASDLAQQLTKDPYIFDFLTIEPGYAERLLVSLTSDRALAEARFRCPGWSLSFAAVLAGWWPVTFIWRALPRAPVWGGRG